VLWEYERKPKETAVHTDDTNLPIAETKRPRFGFARLESFRGTQMSEDATEKPSIATAPLAAPQLDVIYFRAIATSLGVLALAAMPFFLLWLVCGRPAEDTFTVCMAITYAAIVLAGALAVAVSVVRSYWLKTRKRV
jgi:hypothetical protein